jgi:hypothetical protein
VLQRLHSGRAVDLLERVDLFDSLATLSDGLLEAVQIVKVKINPHTILFKVSLGHLVATKVDTSFERSISLESDLLLDEIC